MRIISMVPWGPDKRTLYRTERNMGNGFYNWTYDRANAVQYEIWMVDSELMRARQEQSFLHYPEHMPTLSVEYA